MNYREPRIGNPPFFINFNGGVKAIAVYFKNGMEVLESGNTALVLANTVISGPGLPSTERKATYVFNKSPNGKWLCSIDNSYGHEIIGKYAL